MLSNLAIQHFWKFPTGNKLTEGSRWIRCGDLGSQDAKQYVTIDIKNTLYLIRHNIYIVLLSYWQIEYRFGQGEVLKVTSVVLCTTKINEKGTKMTEMTMVRETKQLRFESCLLL